MPSKNIILTIVGIGIVLAGVYMAYQPRPTPTVGAPQPTVTWKHYGKDGEGEHFYKPDTSRPTSAGIEVVWDQVVFSPEGKERYIRKRQQAGFTTEGYDALSHRTVLYEVNCFSKKREYSTQEVFELTGDGKRLDYARAGTYKDWQEVPPGSMIDHLCTIVCPERR